MDEGLSGKSPLLREAFEEFRAFQPTAGTRPGTGAEPQTGTGFWNGTGPRTDTELRTGADPRTGLSADFSYRIRISAGSGFGQSNCALLYQNPDCAYPTRLFQMKDGSFQVEFQKGDSDEKLSFVISKDWTSLTLTEDSVKDSGEMLFQRLGALFSMAILNFQSCVMHCAVLDYEGSGILLIAPSGTGKSTHSSKWAELGYASVLNGDRGLCCRMDGSWYVYGMPWAGSSDIRINRGIPLHAVVALEQAKANEVVRLNPLQKELSLLRNMFATVTEGPLQEAAYACAADLAEKIPILKLRCLPDQESVEVLKGYLDGIL